MAKIRMLQTRYGKDDAIGLTLYEKGNVYDVRDSLASQFNSLGYSEAADVIYYQIKWVKTGNVTREPITRAIEYFLERGIAQLMEA